MLLKELERVKKESSVLRSKVKLAAQALEDIAKHDQGLRPFCNETINKLRKE